VAGIVYFRMKRDLVPIEEDQEKKEDATWGGLTLKASIVTSVRRDGGGILSFPTYQ